MTVTDFGVAIDILRSQVKVTGGGSKQPSAADLVDIPGVYDSTVFPDIWADNFHSFTVPGPPVAFATSGGTANAGSPPPAAPEESSSSSHVPTSSHAQSSSNAPAPSSTHAASVKVPSPSPVRTHSASASSAHLGASSTLVSASPSPTPSSSGRCRRRQVRRHSEAESKRLVRKHVRAKRHH